MTTTAAAPQTGDTPPWWAAFPAAKASCPRIEATEVKKLLDVALIQDASKHRDFLLVDVRQTDWTGGTIATSLNLPSQSFYPTRPVVYQLCKQAGIKTMIFYCGSSSGRGPRSASWMQDYLDQVGDADIKAVILAGGIKGWQKLYGGKLMDHYDEASWAAQGGN